MEDGSFKDVLQLCFVASAKKSRVSKGRAERCDDVALVQRYHDTGTNGRCAHGDKFAMVGARLRHRGAGDDGRGTEDGEHRDGGEGPNAGERTAGSNGRGYW